MTHDSDSSPEILIDFRQYIQEDTHIILLTQPGESNTRTYFDYDSVRDCMNGICYMYEEHMKRQNPEITSVTYTIPQLFQFIDQLSDLCCLIYQESTNTYSPYNKEWIKEKIYMQLSRIANKSV